MSAKTTYLPLFFCLNFFATYGQITNTLVIQGPTYLCASNCDTFTAFAPNIMFTDNDQFFWTVTSTPGIGSSYTSQGPSQVLCFDSPGVYNIHVAVENPQFFMEGTLTVYVGELPVPQLLYSDTPACPPASDTSQCERLCAETTVTYTFNVPFTFPGNGVVFVQSQASNVSNIQYLGNQVRITWAAPGIGTLHSEYTRPNQSGGTEPQCTVAFDLCVEILAPPLAGFTTLPASQNDTIHICTGEEVQFQNTSSNTDHYLWDFGDFSTSTQPSPSHVFNQAGVYDISMVANSGCNCADTTFAVVIVENTNSPPISCGGPVCQGETVTYTTDADCGVFNWQVSSNGTVVDGGGSGDNFITITWNGGYLGQVTLETINCNNAAPCLRPTTLDVPIISDDAQIDGPAKVCPGATERYALPPYDGAEITWSVSPGGAIEEGQGTNEISVTWDANADPDVPQWVAVTFNHCYLGCGGSDTLDVKIRPAFRVTGTVQVCPDETAGYFARSFENNDPVSSNWEARDAVGMVVWTSPAPGSNASVTWSVPPGNYQVIAFPEMPDDFCTDSAYIKVNVPAAPTAIDSIEGARLVCIGKTFTYEAVANANNVSYQWEISNGGSITTRSGQRINVTWLSPANNSLTVSQTNAQGCSSPPVTIQIQPLSAPPISGDTTVCVEAIGAYNTTSIPQGEYEWSIIPGDAGTVISDPDQPGVQVLWHKPGPATVRLKICSQTTNFPVTVNPPPMPDIQYPAELCSGAVATVQTTAAFNSYSWRGASGGVISNDPMPDIAAGYYQLIVTDAEGCSGDALFQIKEIPAPQVRISTPNIPCLNIGTPTLYTLSNQTGSTYEWYRDGASIGLSTASIAASQPGVYTVQVTDANGCISNSNPIEVFGNCGGAGGGGGLPGGGAACDPSEIDPFDINPGLACNIRGYQIADPDFVPGTALWNFDDPDSGASNFSSADSPTHTYATAGFHQVLMVATYNDGMGGTYSCGILQVDTVTLAANFIADPACPGAQVQFNDRSTYLPFESIVGWQWNFGDPASGPNNNSNLDNPIHIFNTPGTYTVSLTVLGASGCPSTFVQDIEVFSPPTVPFDEPAASCEGRPIEFTAAPPADIANLAWDFGDPGSGDANTSSLADTYHTFEVDFNYVVTLTATDIRGCISTFDRIINVADNTLNGSIGVMPGNQLCEGDTAVLNAPAGGFSWSWNTEDSTATIQVTEEGIYKVTITDAMGCEYTPNAVNIQVIPAPSATIRAVIKDEFGQPIAFVYDSLEVCAGEDIFLEAQSQGLSNTYSWTTGQSGQLIEFSENRGNLLPVGMHLISVTVHDALTGCDRMEGPFVITVHPNPLAVQISSNPSGLLCETVPITFSVDNPEAGASYFWTTGQTGESIINTIAGEYYATAVNTFGCRTQSNSLFVQNGPNIHAVPSGCHTRCRPDTICLAPIANAVSYQWYFDGAAIAGPAGTMLNLVPDQSGEYTLEITDSQGCTAVSAGLNLDLFDGYGTIEGNVYVDVNDNGIIDAADTLFSGAMIQVVDNGTTIDTLVTAGNGHYIVLNLPADGYNLQLDTAALPNFYTALYSIVDTALVGCNDSITVDWLLKICPVVTTSLELTFCQGGSVDYNGTAYDMETTFSVTYQSLQGCDSIEMVNVTMLPTSTLDVDLISCPGVPVTFNGMTFNVGDSFDFIYTNQFGCDSIISVGVQALPTDMSSLTLETCPGTPVDYNGTTLNVGDQTDFVLTNQTGCDSVVTVTVTALPTSTGSETLFACPGNSVTYNGTALNAGDQMDFVLTNSVGCDSVVTVTVTALQATTGNVSLFACPGTTIDYEGITIAAGSQATVTLTNSAGCDSVITVTVQEYSTNAESLMLTACPGESVIYNGTSLAPGSQTVFTFPNQFGCDSVVTVTVDALVLDTTAVMLQACEGSTVDYNGITLAAGEIQTVVLTNQQGCDSVVVVSVAVLANPMFTLVAEASCPNTGTGSIEAQNAAGGQPPYSYSIDGTTFQSQPLFDNLTAGTYTALINDDNGCQGMASIIIPALAPLVLDTASFILPCNDPQISIGVAVLSGLQDNMSYEWDNGETTPTRIVTETGVYSISVSNDCQRVKRDVVVFPEKTGREGVFYIPNSFSPNDDGINDLFQVFTGEDVNVKSFLLRVFDRWGNELFETADYTAGWDGWYRSKAMNPAVYVWYLKAEVERCGADILIDDKGDVAIVK